MSACYATRRTAKRGTNYSVDCNPLQTGESTIGGKHLNYLEGKFYKRRLQNVKLILYPSLTDEILSKRLQRPEGSLRDPKKYIHVRSAINSEMI